MSDTADWTIIVRNSQKAARAAEAALEIAQRLETDFSVRLTAIEGRMATFAAGLNSLQRAGLRIADIQDDHTARLDAIDSRLDGIDVRLGNIEATLAAILAKLP